MKLIKFILYITHVQGLVTATIFITPFLVWISKSKHLQFSNQSLLVIGIASKTLMVVAMSLAQTYVLVFVGKFPNDYCVYLYKVISS